MTIEPQSRFLRACHGLPVDRTPIWLMRQAGRYMQEYREIRVRHSMLEVIDTPQLAAEVTLQPINAFDLDAAIIFSDILPPLIGMGLDLSFVKNVGPRIERALQSRQDIERLKTPPAESALDGTLQAIRLTKSELDTRGIPLIGFAGAPFTLASYAVEGGSSRNYAKTKVLMYSEPDAWHMLMSKLVTVISDYLIQQARAGADVLQVFDSWAGCLGRQDYVRYVKPFSRQLFENLSGAGVPVIHFSTGTSAYLEDIAAAGGDIFGVDWRLPLDEAWLRTGVEKPIQGNLDSVTLLAPWEELQNRAADILRRAAGRPGHIFNLGHGIIPQTPPDNVKRLVDFVHEYTLPPEPNEA